MRVLVQRFRIEYNRHAGLAALPLVLMAQQILVGNDIGPVVSARVVHTQQHLTETRKSGQCFEHLGRQRRYAKHDHPRG